MKGAKTVEDYIAARPEWADALGKLRGILTSEALEETVKWGAPCYTVDGKNVIGVAAFKDYVGLWFHQGVFLSDPQDVLVNAQEGKTKALRQWRFGAAKEIVIKDVRAYVREAIANQKAGKVVPAAPRANQKAPAKIPGELAALFAADPVLKKAFAALTPGKQREYVDHISSAKREATRMARAEKAVPLIRDGLGLNDKYRNC